MDKELSAIYDLIMLISIVVPVFNEDKGLMTFHQRLNSVIGNFTDADWEILYVDDGSTDQSLSLIKSLAERDSRVQFLSFSRNFGHQAALTAGLQKAKGDAVITMDSDLQHPPELIPQFLAAWLEGHQVVLSQRVKTESISWQKAAFSSAFYWVFQKLANLELLPGSADFRLLDKKVVLVLNSLKEKSRFLRGLIVWVGFKTSVIEYKAPNRHAGESKYSFLKSYWLAVDGITAFSTRPLYFSLFLGLSLAGLGFLYLMQALVVYLGFPHYAVPGWTSILSVVLIVGGFQLVILGVMGFYLGRIFEEVKARPSYIITESSETLTKAKSDALAQTTNTSSEIDSISLQFTFDNSALSKQQSLSLVDR